MSTWIDFNELRQKLQFEKVLLAYGVELKIKTTAGGRQHQGFCPLPTCNEGAGRSPSFSANIDKGIWHCFSCGAKGNVLDFGVRMEGRDPDEAKDFRRGALRLNERFFGKAKPAEFKPKSGVKRKKGVESAPHPGTARVVSNAPLDFELKDIDPNHSYLKERGFTPETISHFGMGYCGRGLMRGRVAIPLHDMEGRCIGYAGRVVDDSLIGENNPRYLFPPKREREGIVHEFRKSEFLYNGYQIKEPVDDLIVVESFTALWWLWQHGYQTVVALMGSCCSDHQAEHIVKMSDAVGRIWLLPDGDEAGELCVDSLLRLISPHRFVRWVRLRKNQQPTDLRKEELKVMLNPQEGGSHAGK